MGQTRFLIRLALMYGPLRAHSGARRFHQGLSVTASSGGGVYGPKFTDQNWLLAISLEKMRLVCEKYVKLVRLLAEKTDKKRKRKERRSSVYLILPRNSRTPPTPPPRTVRPWVSLFRLTYFNVYISFPHCTIVMTKPTGNTDSRIRRVFLPPIRIALHMPSRDHSTAIKLKKWPRTLSEIRYDSTKSIEIIQFTIDNSIIHSKGVGTRWVFWNNFFSVRVWLIWVNL